ncbi:transposase [Streptomyces mirabilis]|uniref:transposase n=2 Tax=Streptomyces TaxID=1883 RepID=UPI003325F79C
MARGSWSSPPAVGGRFGPIPDLRHYFSAVMWRSRTGSPWRDVPERYGSWSTVYDGFRVWARDGVFQALMEAVIAEAAARDDVDLSLVSVDSTVARAHHHAAGVVVDPELLEDLEKAVAEEKGATAKGRNDPVGEGPGGREDPPPSGGGEVNHGSSRSRCIGPHRRRSAEPRRNWCGGL